MWQVFELDLLFAKYRYMYQHGYNISLVELVDRIADPPVKASMTEYMYKKLDSFPTPTDVAKALSTCKYSKLPFSPVLLVLDSLRLAKQKVPLAEVRPLTPC